MSAITLTGTMISARPRLLFKVTFLKHFALEVWVSIVFKPLKAALSVTFDLLILKIMFLFFKNTVKILKFR